MEVLHIARVSTLVCARWLGCVAVERAPGMSAMDTSRSTSEMRWAFLMLVALGLAVTLTIYMGLSG